MRPAENIKKLIKNMTIKTNRGVNDAVLNDLFAELDKSQSTSREINTWRIIMNSRITKLAAAAVIIIAVVLSINVLDRSVSSAYALEQTVEAFKNVRFLHLVRRDNTGQIKDERWIELGQHGMQVRYRQENPGWSDIEDGTTTAVYHKDKKTVVLYDGEDMQYQWIGPLGLVLENLHQKGRIIEENIEYNGQLAHKVLWPIMNAECYIDPKTKLPIAIDNTELSYEQPPSNIFEIAIPEGYVVVDKRKEAEPSEEPQWLEDKHLADKYFDQARHALVEGDYQKAVELFEFVIEKQPLRNWAWFWLGSAYYEQGKYDFAIEKFSKVIKMMKATYALYARGLAYAQNGMEDAANADLEKALPWMIGALRDLSQASMFEYADDPFLRDGRRKPTKQQILSRMINRLRIITGQNFGFDPAADNNEQAIAAWEGWFEDSGEINFTPDIELVPVN